MPLQLPTCDGRSSARIQRALIRCLALAVALGLGCAALSPAQQADHQKLKVETIRRVVLPKDRWAAELARAQKGVWVQMPREEFEALVRKASRAATDRPELPRLVKAQYRARLEKGALAGSATWRVISPGSAAALLPVQPLSLALWQSPADRPPALLAEFDGKTPALLLEESGEREVFLEWTARGEARPEGLAFDFRVPVAAMASLEVKLPADQALVVSAPENCLVAGPQPAEDADHRLWTVAFAGKSRLQLTVKRSAAPGQPPPLVAALTTTQSVTPDGLEARYAFDLRPATPGLAPRAQGLREFLLEGDPALRPVDVIAPNLESWETRPPTSAGAPLVIAVRVREPFSRGVLQVRCLAPFGRSASETKKQPPPRDAGPPWLDWTAPGLRLADVVPRGEKLVVQFDPEVRPRDWNSGSFRLVQTALGPEGQQEITLEGGGWEGGRRPSARLEARGVEYRARQQSWWQILPDGRSLLTVQMNYEVARGRLFQLPLGLPPGWRVERVELNQTGLLRDWRIRHGGGRPTLLVDLERPLAASAPATRLTVRLSLPPPRSGLAWDFPDVTAVGARLREGGLAIEFDERAFQPHLSTTAVPADPGEEGPWGKWPPDRYFPYHGQAVHGTLKLSPRPLRVGARCTSEVVLAPSGVAVVTHLSLQPDVGSPETIDLHVSAPVARWEWRTTHGNNQVKSCERLPPPEAVALLGALCGAGRPLGGTVPAVVLAQRLLASGLPPERGERWRLTLARPLREPLTLDATCELPRPAADRWEVPLLTVAGATRMDGEVTLYLTGPDLVRIESEGLREASAGPRGAAAPPWRTYRYGAPPIALRLHGRPHAGRPAEAPEAIIAWAALTTTVDPGGRLIHHHRFRVVNWRQHTLPLRLPAGAEVLAARVDGRWLGQLSAVEAEGHIVMELPIPNPAGSSHGCEIAYAVAGPSFRLWAKVDTPPSILPVEPLALRRTWRLPPSLAPLPDGRCRPLARPDPPQSAASRLANAITLFPRPGLTGLRQSLLEDDWAGRQSQHLAEAAAALRRDMPARTTTLGDLIQRLAFDHLTGHGLVLDTRALAEAGLGPGTPLPGLAAASPWEAVGLVYVPCRAAPLLTTRRQREAWQTAAGEGAGGREPFILPYGSLAEAIAEAAANGHDRSGRFQSAGEWLRTGGMDATLTGAGPDLLALGSDEPNWTEWESLAGADPEASLLVVRRDALPAVGWVLAAMLAAAFWRARRQPARWRLRFLVLWLGGSALALLWLPMALHGLAWGPLIAGAAAAIAWYLWSIVAGMSAARQASGKSSIGPAPAAGAAALALLAALWLESSAWTAADDEKPEETGPPTVFLLPAPPDAPNRERILAPPVLVGQLRELAGKTEEKLPAAVFVGATYDGKVRGASALFEAEYRIQCLSDGPATLTLPLDYRDVDLQEMLLDGADAHQVALPSPQVGYAFRVSKRGLHKLRLRFTVRVATNGDEGRIQFTAPPLVQGKLTLEAPAGARDVQALMGQVPVWGAQQARGEGAPRLQADLGRLTAPLIVRWHKSGAAHAPARVRLKETYLWDLTATGGTLGAVLDFTPEGGALREVGLDVPDRLDVLNVQVAAPTGPAAPRLADWQLTSAKGGIRRLVATLATPVAGAFQLYLEMAPRRLLSAREPLPLPAPRGAEAAENLLAVRLVGLEHRIANHRGLTGSSPTEFVQRWQATGRPNLPADPASHLLVYRFDRDSRKPGAGPLLQVDLWPAATQARATQQLTWRVGIQQADFRLSARLTASGEDLTIIEWEVPPGTRISQVSGRDLRYWNQSGTRVQAWLAKPAAETELQLSGWLPLAANKPPPGKPSPAPRFDRPCLRLLMPGPQQTQVRLVAAPGMAILPLQTHGLMPAPTARASGQELVYIAPQAGYTGTFRLDPAEARVQARVLTFAEVRERRLAFVVTADIAVRQGELRTAVLRLRNWQGDARVEGADVMRSREQRRRPEERTLFVELRPGVTGRCRLLLSGGVPLGEAAPGLLLPDVSVVGAQSEERWVAVAGKELAVESPQRLTRETDVARMLATRWPGEADRVRRAGTAWRVAGDDWSLRVVPRSPAGGEAVRVFLVEQSASVADGRHWDYQTTWWLYHEANTDLAFTLPEGVRVLGVAIDGADVPPLEPAPNRLWVPLPGAAGARRVRLRWRFADGAESLTRPRLEPPRLEGATSGRVIGSMDVPAGLQASPLNDGGSGLAEAAAQDLRRAEAQLQLSEVLADRAHGGDGGQAAQLALAQKRFYHFCRYADHSLALAAATGVDAEPLRERLHQLQGANLRLAADQAFESTRAEAERLARSGALNTLPRPATRTGAAAGSVGLGVWPVMTEIPSHGTPIRWQAEPDNEAPGLRLTAVSIQELRRCVAATGLLLVVCLTVWVLARFAGLVDWARMFWPEQLALIGCLAWQTFGPSLGILFFILLGVCARLVYLSQWMLARLRHRASVASTPANGSAN